MIFTNWVSDRTCTGNRQGHNLELY